MDDEEHLAEVLGRELFNDLVEFREASLRLYLDDVAIPDERVSEC